MEIVSPVSLHPGTDRSMKACASSGPPSGCARMSRRGTVGETATRWALKLMHILRVSGSHPSWDRTRSHGATGVSAGRDCGRPDSPRGILVGPSPAPSPGTPSVLAGEVRSQGGGGGRVQAERQTRQDPQGQGYGPEGERTVERTRSPGPGRWCPCGCPRQVVQLSRPPGEPSVPNRVAPHHYDPPEPPASTLGRPVQAGLASAAGAPLRIRVAPLRHT